jgi:arsenate reductase-like glutaredoxin family protein
MNIAENEMLFIYNSGNKSDREALGYAKGLKSYVLKEFDVKRDRLSETQLKEIANQINVKVRDLIDITSDTYVDQYASANLADTDLLITLSREPELLRTPIVLKHKCGYFVASKYDFNKVDMNPSELKSPLGNSFERPD